MKIQCTWGPCTSSEDTSLCLVHGIRRKLGRAYKQLPSGWVVLACSLEDRIRHVTENPERFVTRLQTSLPQSVPLASCDKAAGKAIESTLLIQLLWEPHHGCLSRSSLCDKKEPERESSWTALATWPGPAAHTPPGSWLEMQIPL